LKIKNFYIELPFFIALAAVILFFILSFFFAALYYLSISLFIAFLVFTLCDILLLFASRKGINARRVVPEKMSNGDENPVEVHIKNNYTMPLRINVIDEIPFQFQKRDIRIIRKIDKNSEIAFRYWLRPTERGEYFFGRLMIYVQSPLKLISRRFIFSNDEMVPVYPSFIQLRKYDLLAMAWRNEAGLKKVRRIGHTMEFEQIMEYIPGDDIRTINWNATAKRNQLMVNRYQDEKSQPVYSIIDKGRVMKMPFNELSLLDYAINTTLVMSSVTTKNHDKAGLFCFSKNIENLVAAERRTSQMNLIIEALYNIKTDFKESDFGRLYSGIKQNIRQRSLLFLYTNFETIEGLERQLPYILAIAKQHVLVVVFFENTELQRLINTEAVNLEDIYVKTIAEKFAYEKKLIVKELEKRGVFSILTKPENLTINAINKYLEIKSRGLI
jgi:uncharacterized protein (DUF58 family)